MSSRYRRPSEIPFVRLLFIIPYQRATLIEWYPPNLKLNCEVRQIPFKPFNPFSIKTQPCVSLICEANKRRALILFDKLIIFNSHVFLKHISEPINNTFARKVKGANTWNGWNLLSTDHCVSRHVQCCVHAGF